jgi:hypothetical protein
MLQHMRTTVVLPDALLTRAKRYAEQHGLSVSGLIEQSLADLLARPTPAAKAPPPFRLITFGGSGLQPGVTWERLREIEDEEEADRARLPRPSRANDGDAAP